MITTIHGFSSDRVLPVYQKFDADTHYVAISQADRHPTLTYAATVLHGIDLGEFAFKEVPEDYLLFFGRIHPDNGAAQAIKVAQQTGRRLIIAGIVQDPRYFESEINPHLSDQIQYVGSVGPSERSALLGGARALLHLIDFDEPFGLSMVEAMACGTPVIAMRRGSVPEIVKDGISGFTIQNESDACLAVTKVQELPRVKVREYAEQHFNRERMVTDYITVYEKILGDKRQTRTRVTG